ncbi:MAG TPA: hypothetical protein VF189_01300 [Patescibacteria group bacterium]
MPNNRAKEFLDEFQGYHITLQEVIDSIQDDSFDPNDYPGKIPTKMAARRLGINLQTLKKWQKEDGIKVGGFVSVAILFGLLQANEKRRLTANNGLAKKIHYFRRQLTKEY